jgi:putative ubiquitin-RnfH superfamily antitoxin RatB of RatAB toxin-antitoxin module
MERKSTLKQFKKLVSEADIIYSQVRLNAALKVDCRIRKSKLLSALNKLDINKVQAGLYYEFLQDKKGRKILKVL